MNQFFFIPKSAGVRFDIGKTGFGDAVPESVRRREKGMKSRQNR
jgi:hypothetical protein